MDESLPMEADRVELVSTLLGFPLIVQQALVALVDAGTNLHDDQITALGMAVQRTTALRLWPEVVGLHLQAATAVAYAISIADMNRTEDPQRKEQS